MQRVLHRSYWLMPWMCPQSLLWQWSTVGCSMFEHIEGRNWTCKHRCVLGEGCIGGCGWSWFLVGSLLWTVVWCKLCVDGLYDRINSSYWESASLVEFSSQGNRSSWWRWNISCSQCRQTFQPCIAVSSLLIWFAWYGSQTTPAYSRTGLTRVVYAFSFVSLEHPEKFWWRRFKEWWAFVTVFLTWSPQSRSFKISTPKYGWWS